MRLPVLIDDSVFNERLEKLVKALGDPVQAGVSLEEVADMVYTRRTRINPSVGEQAVIGTGRKKTTGPAMDDILG